MASLSFALCLEADMVLWGRPVGVLGFLPGPWGKEVWAKAEIADHPQLPLRRLLLMLPKMAALPHLLFLLCLLQTPASPTSRDILIGGRRGVPTFWEPSLCQSEVTPRTMSQPSHLQQALCGRELGPGTLPARSPEASSYGLQPPLLPGNPVPLAQVAGGR